ncbi:MAG: ATP-binding protein [Terriglobia bacterium]|jgi:signal transduction histidine kinase
MNQRRSFAWMDLLWLAFLAGLAVLPPRSDIIHKQLILLAIGVFQIFEYRILEWVPERGRSYSVIVKILLGSLLLDHTGGIESPYYLIYFVPVVTAAMYFELWATLAWTMLTSMVYCSFVGWALIENLDPLTGLPALEVTAETITELAIRNLFFFLAAVVVNRFVTENREQVRRYRELAETLAETNRRLEEAQEEARRSERLAALGQLSAGLAHELRNPLAVIKGSAETLMRKLASSDPITTEMAGYISSEVNRMNALVTRFLDFARPHKLEEHLEPVPPLIERALKEARDRWPDAKVEVERQFAPDLPEVTLDGDLIERVFTNLALNAYEAMGPGGGELRVAAAPSSDGKGGVEITFQDTGPGIPAALREQIFNPFFTTKETGVGLGLSIVSKIVDDHRGWIRVTSEPGKGACFQVFLPAGGSTDCTEYADGKKADAL